VKMPIRENLHSKNGERPKLFYVDTKIKALYKFNISSSSRY
jgi:hypothetical protein